MKNSRGPTDERDCRQPRRQHGHLPGVRRRDDGHRDPGLAPEQDRFRLLHRWPLLHGRAERYRHRGRLPVGRQLPRYHRCHRPYRLRRLPLLDRLPGRVAGGPSARRRTAAQHRQVHDGRRARVPHAAASGADGRGDLDAGGLVLLPARPDGRCRWSGQPADGHHGQRRAVVDHRGRRHPDDRLRPRRRHEGHHVGADHQGRAAHRRCRSDDRLGVQQVRLQPVQPHGCRGGQQPAR